MTNEAKLLLELIRNDFKPDIHYEIPSEFSWSEFLGLIVRQRIFFLAYHALLDQIPDEQADCFEQFGRKQRMKINLVQDALHDIEEITKKQHIKFLLIKGAAISNQIYGGNEYRQYNDIDILVEEDDMICMDRIVRDIGFKQPFKIGGNRDNIDELPYPVLIIPEHQHYFEYFKEVDGCIIKLEITRHMHYLEPPLIFDFFWNPQQIRIGSVSYNALSTDYTLVNLIANTYKNSEDIYHAQRICYIRDYVDLHFFLKKYDAQIEWGFVLAKIKEYGLQEKARIVFENLYKLYGDPISLRCKERFEPVERRDENMYIDWQLDFPERIFDDQARRMETIGHIKQKLFCEEKYQNGNFQYRIGDQYSESGFRAFPNKYRLEISYLIHQTTSGLNFVCRVPDNLYRELDKFMIELVIYNGDYDNQQLLYSLFDIGMEDGEIRVKYFRTDTNNSMHGSRADDCYAGSFLAGDSRKDERTREILVEIPRAMVDDTGNTRLAYAVRLFKNMRSGIYHCKSSTPLLFQALVLTNDSKN